MLPRLTAALTVVALAIAVPATNAGAAPASPTTPTVPPSVVEGRPDTECISANPRPDCYQSEEFPRSSRAHLLLFGVLGLALAGIGAVVVRSTRRHDRARTGPAAAPER